MKTNRGWLNAVHPDVRKKFEQRYFDGSRQRKSQFVTGNWNPSPKLSMEMKAFLEKHGVRIGLHRFRPDIYGPRDQGAA